MIQHAEERGDLASENLVEPTSGNTGLGLVMVGNARGYKLTTPLSAAIPAEKRSVLRFFGCEVIEPLDDSLCPAPGAPEGAMAAGERDRAAARLPPAEPVREPRPTRAPTTAPPGRRFGGRPTAR